MSKQLTAEQLKLIDEKRARALEIRRQREAEQADSVRAQPHQSFNLTSSNSIRSGLPQLPFPPPTTIHNTSPSFFYPPSHTAQVAQPTSTSLSRFAFTKPQSPSSSSSPENVPNQPKHNSGMQERSRSISSSNSANGASRTRNGNDSFEIVMALVSPDRFEINMNRFDQSMIDAFKAVPSRLYCNR